MKKKCESSRRPLNYSLPLSLSLSFTIYDCQREKSDPSITNCFSILLSHAKLILIFLLHHLSPSLHLSSFPFGQFSLFSSLLFRLDSSDEWVKSSEFIQKNNSQPETDATTDGEGENYWMDRENEKREKEENTFHFCLLWQLSLCCPLTSLLILSLMLLESEELMAK